MTALEGLRHHGPIRPGQSVPADGVVREGTSAVNEASPRVIADHLRSAGFLVADGVLDLRDRRRDRLARLLHAALELLERQLA